MDLRVGIARIAGMALLCVHGAVSALEKTIELKSSYDGSKQEALLFVPSGYDGKRALPLLASAHYMGGNKSCAKGHGYHRVCEALGWLVVCPDLHGLHTSGKTSLAALPAQHDLIDAIQWVRGEYKVDDTRIYLAGRSMGGMLALVMAGKYPDLFACVVAGQPITDLTWRLDNIRGVDEMTAKECGGTPEEVPFEYQRRSAIHYASNMQYVPVVMWHGTADRIVPVKHTKRVFAEMRKFNEYQYPICWLEGAGHNPLNYGPEWICEKLRWHAKTRERQFLELDLVTDESKSFFWLDVTQARPDRFSRIHARLEEDELIIKVRNVSRVEVRLDAIHSRPLLTEVKLKSDQETTLKITGLKGEPGSLEQSFRRSGTVRWKEGR